MASLFGSWGADPFGELVEKATSELLPAGQEDIALNLEICDQVRAKQVPAKQAMQTLKRRISHKNPNVVLLALGLTDICIKNGGDHFLAEVASREFMDNLAAILRNPTGSNFEVKTKALRLIQNWSQIADKKPQQMGYITETYKTLKSSGFDFPPADPAQMVSAALVETLTAPEWTDSDLCTRCRSAFTTFNRKHHCRNCGNVFCQDCSSKSMSLPWFGVGQDVRVCDGCFAKKAPPKRSSSSSDGAKVARSKSTIAPTGRGGAGSHHRSNTLGSHSTRASSSRKREEDDLALAIKLSLESSGSAPDQSRSQPFVREGRPTKQANGRMLEGTDADDDPDLAAAIAASLRDYAQPEPSAPFEEGRSTPRMADYASAQTESKLPLPPSLELPASDVDSILTFAQGAMSQEMYARQYGRWQTNTVQQQQLQNDYERATAARPRMAKSLDEATRRHGVLLSMHDKLSEAVRLYDRLLDAQMSRPAYGAYGQAPRYGQANDAHHYNGVQGTALHAPLYPQQPQYTGAQVSYGQDPAAYPAYAPPNTASPAEAGHLYGRPSFDPANVQQPAQSYGLPESPSPYPNHQSYMTAGHIPPYAQPNYVPNMHAGGPGEVYAHPSAPAQPTQPHLTESAYAEVTQGEYAGANPLSPHSETSLHGPLTGSAVNGQSQWQMLSEGASAPELQASSPVDQQAKYYGNEAPSFQTKASTQEVHSPQALYHSAAAAQSGPPNSIASLSNTMAATSLSPEANVSLAVDQSGNSGQERLPPLQQQQQQQRYQQQQQYSVTANQQQGGWQDVHGAHPTSSIISSAPPPPQVELDATLSMPSAPITSPSAKLSSSHSIPNPYDAIGAPSTPGASQPWTRPMETPLIDL